VASLEAHPLLGHLPDKSLQVTHTLSGSAAAPTFGAEAAFSVAGTTGGNIQNFPDPTLFGRGLFLLLDVSSNADQMGVSFGTSIYVGRDPNGETSFRTVGSMPAATTIGNSFPLQIDNMDVVANAQNLRVVTLPQISWEPLFNIPLVQPYDATDSITTAPGPVVFDNDGIPTIIASTSPYQTPVAPLPTTRHFLKGFNDKHVPRSLYAAFTLPFGMEAEAAFIRNTKGRPEDWSRLHFNQPYFPQLHGGLQIKARAPASPSTQGDLFSKARPSSSITTSSGGSSACLSLAGHSARPVAEFSIVNSHQDETSRKCPSSRWRSPAMEPQFLGTG
jgi:hypothetical protein